MAVLYLVPNWFFGFDIFMEIIFGIITLAVALAAYKIYRISEERSMKNFSAGFFMISLSYICWAMMNFFIANETGEGLREISVHNIAFIGAIGLYAHILFLSIGLVTLVYATLSIKKPSIYYLLIGLELMIIAVSLNKLATFRIVSVFLLSYITYHFFVEWREHKSRNLMYSFIAFSLLLISNLEFALSTNYYLAYVFGHLFELIAYIIILKNLIKTTFVKRKK